MAKKKLSDMKMPKRLVDKQRESIMQDIDNLISAENMSAKEALEVLDEIRTDISSRQDGLRDDIKNQD